MDGHLSFWFPVRYLGHGQAIRSLCETPQRSVALGETVANLSTPCFSLKIVVGFQVLGEAYSTLDEEDMAVKEVTAISISQGRYLQ